VQVKNYSKSIWTIENFKTEKECREFLLAAEKNNAFKGKAEEKILADKKLAIETWMRLSRFVPKQFGDSKAIGLNERFRFYKFEKGQQLKKRKDAGFSKNENEACAFTCMLFLNDDFKGGEVKFDKISIQPAKGMALVFEQDLEYEFAELKEGVQYILCADVLYRLPN
jgi:prolyl 4-hydroxylase